jgi:putative flippase GtrA
VNQSLTLNARVTSLLRSRPVIIQILRFAAIGSINTALDFIILNFITKSLGISSGVALGALSAVSFSAAIIQSYFWNKAWAFAESVNLSVFQNAFRLVAVGGVGFAAFVAVFLGAAKDAAGIYFLYILAAFLISQFILWKAFGMKLGASRSGTGAQFFSFLIVSLVGLLINSVIVVIATHFITPYVNSSINADTIKNMAKIVATLFSLVWNFIGYKLIVFKR